LTIAPWQKPTIANKHRPDVLIEERPNPAIEIFMKTFTVGDDHVDELIDELYHHFPPIIRLTYPITGMGKPRATQRDKWNPSKAVQKYRLFADTVRLYDINIPDAGYHITFVLPMPKSWAKKKRAAMDGKPHQQKPDKDNLEKALLDAARKGHVSDDCTIWDGRVSKLWGETGAVIIEYHEVRECQPENSQTSS